MEKKRINIEEIRRRLIDLFENGNISVKSFARRYSTWSETTIRNFRDDNTDTLCEDNEKLTLFQELKFSQDEIAEYYGAKHSRQPFWALYSDFPAEIGHLFCGISRDEFLRLFPEAGEFILRSVTELELLKSENGKIRIDVHVSGWDDSMALLRGMITCFAHRVLTDPSEFRSIKTDVEALTIEGCANIANMARQFYDRVAAEIQRDLARDGQRYDSNLGCFFGVAEVSRELIQSIRAEKMKEE